MSNTGVLYSANTDIYKPLTFNLEQRLAQKNANTMIDTTIRLSNTQLQQYKMNMGMKQNDNVNQLVKESRPGGFGGRAD
jgi:hypothetical protein